MNPPLLRISDWLRHSHESASATDDARAAQLGALAVLAAGFEASDSLDRPSMAMEPLREPLAQLPQQFAGIPSDSAMAEWVNLASLAEFLQAPQLADLLLVELILRLAPQRAGRAHGYGQSERGELAALCWTRRGRVARTQGRFDDAAACYNTALRLAGRVWRDARPQATLGLAALAANRGNIPAAEQLALQVLERGSQVYALYRVPAHQLMTFTLRRRGSLLDAILHGWHAFDLLHADDYRRDEVLITMSEIALAYGDLESAARGFAAVRIAALPVRVRIPALVGTLDVAVQRLSTLRRRDVVDCADAIAVAAKHSVLAAQAPLLALLEGTLSPGDVLLATIALGEAAIELGERNDAMEWIAKAAHIADQHGFHEKRFYVDSLRARIEGGAVREVSTSASGDASTAPVLRRFAALDGPLMTVPL